MPKKPSKKTLKNKLDKAWSKVILSTGSCDICGTNRKQLHPHHIIGRKNLALRWDLKNGICLCASCHVFDRRSAHQDPLWFSDLIHSKYKNRYVYLTAHRYDIKKWTIEGMQKKLEELNG